jgi:hypothetical protein
MDDFVVDGDGRRLALRRVGAVEQLRIFKALGPILSENVPYLNGALVAAAVARIDDLPLPFPSNEAAVEAALERIGLEAMALVAAAIRPRSVEALGAGAGN